MTRSHVTGALPHLDRAAMEAWLRTHAVGDCGQVWSWVNPANPGYDYPEAAALWLRFAAEHLPEGAGRPVADRLSSRVTDGWIGRDGTGFVFDSSVALAGLVTRPGAQYEHACVRLARVVVDGLSRRRVTNGDAPPAGRWSSGYNPHLLKSLGALRTWWERTGDGDCLRAARQLLDDLVPRSIPFHTGIDRRSYTHAFCYAVEGLAVAEDWGLASTKELLARSAVTLARAQRGDGALPAWLDGGPARSDATAQAVRIWTLVDDAAYATSIDAALRWLGTMQRGGVLYEPSRGDVNTWATLFTLQAHEWYQGGADVRELW